MKLFFILEMAHELYSVRDVMSQPAVTVTPKTMLLDAALILRASAIRHLPVVEEDKLVGLITDRDIQRCAPSRLIPITEDGYNSVFSQTTVNRIMTREPVTTTPETPLMTAIAVMQEARFGCLPVVENDKVVGILTRSDLVDTLLRLLSGRSAKRTIDLPSL